MQIKIKKIIITVIVICAIGIPLGMRIYNKSAVEFKDENMEKVMVYASTNEHGGDGTSRQNLSTIKKLRLGYVGYYDTLEDLKWAKNVEEIEINVKPPMYEKEPAYEISKGKEPKEVSKEKVKQYEEELGKILPKLKQLKVLVIVSDYGCEWNTLDFLNDCEQIKEISLIKVKVTDYSVLKQCKSLEKIDFYGAQIEKSEDLDLTGLENLKHISISNTVLAENQEEMKKLQKKYPDVEIYYGNSIFK